MYKKIVLATVISIGSINLAYSAPVPDLAPYDMTQFFYDVGSGSSLHRQGGIEIPNNLYLERDFALILGSGNFDPLFSIKQTLNNITDEVKSKLLGIGSAITATISALPGYIFCRANPLGCQLHENYTIRAEEKAKTAVKYFEDMERDLAGTRGQLEGWFQAGKANRLITAIQEAPLISGKKDLEDIVDKVREYEGKEGLKWIGGIFAGGDGQPPIRPIADTTKAGFNMLLGRAVTNGSVATGTDSILDIWDTPEEAAKWITEVVGEYRPDINNNENQTPAGSTTSGADDGDAGSGGEDVYVPSSFVSKDTTTPALGLSRKVKKEKDEIATRLTDLSNLGGTPPSASLAQIMGKSSNVVLPGDLFIHLRGSKIQGPLINRIAEDVAISNVINYAMEARRMLIAGRNEPHIGSYDIAKKEIDQKIRTLEKDIEMLMFERRISNDLLSSTIKKFYTYQENLYNSTPNAPSYNTGKKLGNGAVR